MFRLAPLLVFLVACGGEAKAPQAPPPRPVQVLTIAPTERRDTGEYLGTLLSRGSVTILPQVNGYVRVVHVKPGQRVEAGATLIEVDAREESAALQSASAQAQSARTTLSLARKAAARAEGLYADGLISLQEIEEKRADLAAAEAAVRAANAQVSERRVVLGRNVVKAPVPGVIGDVDVRVGDYVTSATKLTSIAEAGALELTVAVPAARARKLAPGAPVEVLDGDGSLLVATTAFYVSPEADPRTQLVDVKATFDNTVGLRPSELVRTRVVYATTQALQIPLLALIRQSGGAFVYLVVEKDGQTVVQRQKVTLGPVGERGVVITEGLAAGDRIAISAIQLLRDGAPVAIEAPPAQSAQSTKGP
jgi:RND family efflux transporter MFP subunit